MHDGVTNKYSFEMNRRPITLVFLTPKQIYDEQLKLKKEKMVENESLYIKGPSLLTSFFFCFDDDANIWLDTDLLTLKDVFHDTHSRLNLSKEEEDDTNQVRSKFGLQISVDQFYEIRHIFQTVHKKELKFTRRH